MEIFRKKNVDTRISFPIIDADGDPVTGATGLDSEYCSYDTADHGAAAPSFGDCGHEATEIGTTGIYYLDVAAAEINKDFTHIQVKTSTSGAKTQHILITTRARDADATLLLGTAISTPATAGILDINLKNIANAAVSATTAQLGVNAVQISGDATAADNLEAACDGTTYNVGGGAVVAASVTTKTGYSLAADQAVNCTKFGGTTVTARDIGLSVLVGDKTGFSLSVAGILAIWHQTLADVVTASTIGKLIKDYLDAAISTRATDAKMDIVDTVVDGIETHVHAIDAKTTNLPASPAAVGSKMDIADAPSATGMAALADYILTRAFGSVTYTGTTRCVLTALQAIRNKFQAATGAAGYKVMKEDDSTPSWTGVVTVEDGVITAMDPDS
jgi:hypothetical protein